MQISERKSRPSHQSGFTEQFVGTARQVNGVLFVDPDADRLQSLVDLLSTFGFVGDVKACQDFPAARKRLLMRPPGLLVTNLQLGEYNGLHLVYLAAETTTRCLVYSTHTDELLQRHAKEAGAFYEHSARLPRVLASYVRAALPHRDQRDTNVLDRRRIARGGRRCADV
jgi:DNA-binding response OmpR family regulator